jgi:hypothetical protein
MLAVPQQVKDGHRRRPAPFAIPAEFLAKCRPERGYFAAASIPSPAYMSGNTVSRQVAVLGKTFSIARAL